MNSKSLIFFLALALCTTKFVWAETLSLQDLVRSFNGQNNDNGVNVLFASGNNKDSAVGNIGQHAIGMTQADAGNYLSAFLTPFQWDGTWQDQYSHVNNLRDASYRDDPRLFFNTFCVEIASRTIDNTYVNAKLNLVDNGNGTYKTMIDSTGVYGDSAFAKDHALTLGAALIYQAWLTGELDRNVWNQQGVSEGWREDSSLINRFGEYDIQAAIWAFQGDSLFENYDGTGSTEGYREHAVDFLQSTYGNMFGDGAWWLQAYDPFAHSVEGYSVLVMNLFAGDGNYENGFQDHLVLVRNEIPSTPEPASILIFGLGLGAALARRRTKNAVR